jgi:hypothetical protein
MFISPTLALISLASLTVKENRKLFEERKTLLVILFSALQLGGV